MEGRAIGQGVQAVVVMARLVAAAEEIGQGQASSLRHQPRAFGEASAWLCPVPTCTCQH
jgi:hypothetical protein